MVVCTGLLFLLNTGAGIKKTEQLSVGSKIRRTNTENKTQLTVLEVELVKVHPLHQVSQRFGLKRGQAGVADSPGTEKRRTE